MIRIELLADHLQHLPTLAEWHQQGLRDYNPSRTLPERIERLGRLTGRGEIPTTFVAIEADRPLGSASLTAADLASRPDLGPWLASVCVAPAERGRGIGRMLVERVEQAARDLGHTELFLYTIAAETYYQRHGWLTLEQATDHRGTPISLMRRELA